MGADVTEKLAVIIGREGVELLSRSTVMVLGCGGVGSNCVEALARGGVGSLIIVDKDVVSESNINRQAIAFHSTLGRKKVDVMREMVHDINPSIEVEAHDDFLLSAGLDDFMDAHAGRADWVIDAIDSIAVKLALAEYAQRTGLRLVSSMGGGNKLHPECFAFADIYDTVNCPLCRIMRKEGRKRGIERLPVLYSSELPAPTETAPGSTRADRSDLGTMSYIPPIMGQMLAGWVIRQLLGMDPSPYGDGDE